MKLMKWLKRDRSNRRCSDSHLAMVSSPYDDKYGRNNSLNGADPIRTKEYLQALSEFRARRSLGLSVNFERNSDVSPERNNKLSLNNEKRKTKSDQKPKRKSFPENHGTSQMLSQTLPQIQFLFSNQIFMPGNKSQNKKRYKKQKSQIDKSSLTCSAALSNSPDLFISKTNNNIDFDADDSESPSSPPPEFFKDNSLPYVDIGPTMPLEASNYSDRQTPLKEMNSDGKNSNETRESQKPLLNSSRSEIYATIRKLSDSSSVYGDKAKMIKTVMEELTNYGKDQTNVTDTSIDSIARKLEEKCHIRNKILSKRHFRGVPLVKRSVIKISSNSSDFKNKKQKYIGEGLIRAHWDAVPVTLRGTLDVEYTTRDIDILSSVHHPNILLLMGIAFDTNHRIECVFEECSATLYDILYQQKIHLPINICVEYLSDIANAASHLCNNGYVHTAVSSYTIMITSKGVAKLFGFELCSKLLLKECDDSPVKKKKCEPYKLIYSSPEPEYENIKGRVRSSNDSELDKIDYQQYYQKCSPQNIDERELLTHFRWQAPELFDDVDKKVTPTKTTDVYSICLVLWECFNGVMPWSSLSYRHLSDLYLLWQTGIRLKEGKYPILIHDILCEGLSLNPEDRMSIKDLSSKLGHIKNYVHFGSDACTEDLLSELTKTNSGIDKTNHKTKYKPKMFCEESQQETKNNSPSNSVDNNQPQVTNIDTTNDSMQNESFENLFIKQPSDVNVSTEKVSKSKDHSGNSDLCDEMSMEQNMTMHKTDSTEYCSLLSPDMQKFASRLHTTSISMQPSKLEFDESLRDLPESNLHEKILRLNSNFTPKSYKSLEIKTPPVETLQDLSKIAKRGNSAECPKKTVYHFDVKSTSLPTTPIARSTKIRKYAWLTGGNKKGESHDKNTYKKATSQSTQTIAKFDECLNAETQNDVFDTNINTDNADSEISTNPSYCPDETAPIDNPNDTIDATPFEVEKDSENSTNEEFTRSYSIGKNPFRRSFIGCSTPSINLSDKFRFRSQSWSSKSRANMRKSEHNLTGVDIKPLVAIHEKWIEEATTQKQNRSLSLPNNYRGSAHAVKPASHRVDPVLPYNPNKSHSFITARKSFKKRSPPKGPYHSIPNPVRPAVVKKLTVFPKSEDFFENSLWRKEKEKCAFTTTNFQNSPQCSSTPYKNKSPNSCTVHVDQGTNTETFDELCEAIVRQMKVQELFNTFDQTDGQLPSPLFNTKNTDEEKELLDIMSKTLIPESSEETQNRIYSKPQQDIKISTNITVEPDQMNKSKLGQTQNTLLTGCKNMKNSNDCENTNRNQDEDCHSLPEIGGNVVNKSLKRCQAFPALQTARSTEDMYIDDELSTNNDIHALSDNMLLVPMHSSFHEALCDKADNCCLLKIKEESSNETILIVCDNSQRALRPRSSCSSTSDSDYEANLAEFTRIQNLKIETLPSMNLVDVSTTPLSVIEEVPGEEDLSDNNNSKNIKDLINLYENPYESKCKNTLNALTKTKNSMQSRADEISFLILDNMEECDEHLPDNCDSDSNMKTNNEKFSTDSVIQDFITI